MAVGIAASWVYVLIVIALDGDLVPFLKDVAEAPEHAVIFLVALTGTTVFIEAGPALFGIFLMGWPFYLLSQRFRRASRGHYLLGGLGIAVAVGAPFLAGQIALDIFGPFSVICTEAVAILVAGPLAMWVFWLVVRPDRTG